MIHIRTNKMKSYNVKIVLNYNVMAETEDLAKTKAFALYHQKIDADNTDIKAYEI